MIKSIPEKPNIYWLFRGWMGLISADQVPINNPFFADKSSLLLLR
jgi:hypothetical protein